jgi:flagellar biosynthesis anti-sigma factor FlgM
MKIQGPGKPRPVAPSELGSVKDAKPQRTEASRGERVQVSQLGQMLASARGPDTPDTARVARLKNAIDSGNFKVDPERIAEAMIQEES